MRSTDVDGNPAYSRGTMGVGVIENLIEKDNDEIRFPANEHFGQGMVVWY